MAGALRATTLRSPTEYAWFDVPSAQLPPGVTASMTAETARDYLVYTLANQLYSDFYCQGGATPRRAAAPRGMSGMTTEFVEALSAANCGRGPWESGWEVQGELEGGFVVRRDGLSVLAPRRDCRTDQSGAPAVGHAVSVRLPKDLLNATPGFYMALGDEQLPEDGETVVRLYWNLMAEGAVAFMSEVTQVLNSEGVPFRVKVVDEPAQYVRCDSGVVYLSRGTLDRARAALRNVLAKIKPYLGPATPAFTKPLAPGLGLAEDPGASLESFGQHRCQLLAEGIVRAHERRATALDQQLDAVAETFAERGVNLAAAHLNPGSVDDYDL